MRSLTHTPIALGNGRVGLISDTHGLVRLEALVALKDSELIIHAGDIGSPQVLKALEAIAPVLAIKGNNDRDAWARRYPDVLSVGVNANAIHVIHNVHELNLNTGAHKFKIVVSGHSHHPSVALREGILFINPGSAGPRRFKLPVSVARLKLGGTPRVKIVELKI